MLGLVALAGALGALGRYGVHGLVQSRNRVALSVRDVRGERERIVRARLVVGLLTYQGSIPTSAPWWGPASSAPTPRSLVLVRHLRSVRGPGDARRVVQRAGERGRRLARRDRRVFALTGLF